MSEHVKNQKLGSSTGGPGKAGSPKGGSNKPGSLERGTSKPGSSSGGPGVSVPSKEGTGQTLGSKGAIPRGSSDGPPTVRKNRSGAAKKKARRLGLQGQSHASPTPGAQAQGSSQKTGAKRFRSEGSTPGSGVSRPAKKKVRTAGPAASSYAQAVTADLRVAIIPESYPEEAITEEQFKLVMASLNEVIDEIEVGSEFPKFEDYRWLPQGAIAVSCGDRWTIDWLGRTIPSIQPWEGAKLAIQRHVPKVVKMVAIVNGLADDTATILTRLRRQNPGLRTNLWKVYFRREEPNRVLLVLGADEASVEVLKRLNFKAYAGVSAVTFKVKGATAGPAQVGTATGASSGNAEAMEVVHTQESDSVPTRHELSEDNRTTEDVVTELMALVEVVDTPQGSGTQPSEEAGGSS